MPTLEDLYAEIDGIEWEVKSSSLLKEAQRDYWVSQLRKTYSDKYLLETGMVRPEEIK